MKKLIYSISLVFLFGCCINSGDINCVARHAEKQLIYALDMIDAKRIDGFVSPRTIEKGEVKLVSTQDWTSGFFPGSLWMMYELTGKDKWKSWALDYTLPLEAEQWNGADHDLGFKMYNSYGRAIKYVNNPKYKDVLIQSAKTLATRYSPTVGCIRSWNKNPMTAQWQYPVIIDNMMNLELLLWAAKETGNESFKKIAVQHALTTMNNHFRNDYSCYHVVDYNPQTGKVLAKETHQGYANESSWTRGQAWALYGFTMMYRETKMDEFLSMAKNIAHFIINQDGISQGQIPYWDFNAPNIPNEPYDASSAAVISSALFELYNYSNNSEHLYVAQKLLRTLSSEEFLSEVGENKGFLLKHSTGSKPYGSELDVPLVYADYYFLEAIIRSKEYVN
jgi:rhamnogalacturonyl hydrolase YesR